MIPENASVRLKDAQLEDPDYRELYEAYSPKGRNPVTNPRVLFKVLTCMNQLHIYSDRQQEVACQNRVYVIWLLRWKPVPDHSTIARFKQRCGEKIEVLFYQYTRPLERQNETDHEVVFVDGTKVDSRAGRYTFCWRGIIEKNLSRVKEKVYGLTGLTTLPGLQRRLRKARPVVFVSGKGKCKSREQRDWEQLDSFENKDKHSKHDVLAGHYRCEDCSGCSRRSECCKASAPNNLKELRVHKQYKEKRMISEANITTEEGVILRICRSIQVEGAFGLLKTDFGFWQFLTRGRKNVRTELFFLAMGFNLKKRESGYLKTHLSVLNIV